ncbi:MAG TPA: ABC transporter substrate-binding protein [Acidimicrobiales bacterium]|jgi:branched-chain amino acid transport system substrate-binding protein
MKPDRRCWPIIVLPVLLSVLAACGTRVSDGTEAAAAGPQPASPAEQIDAPVPTPAAQPRATKPAPLDSGKKASVPAPRSAASAASAPVVTGKASRVSTPSQPSAPTSTQASVQASVPKNTDQIVLAANGTYSGPLGFVFTPIVRGTQLWIKSANSRGGVNGHQVRLIVYDDGGDPVRHRANAQRAVEQDGAIAFIGNAESVTGRCCLDYLKSKGVPVVGTDTGEQWVYESPMYFPQGSHGDEMLRVQIGAVAKQAIPAGKTKLAIITCVEVDICNGAQRVWAGPDASRLGFDKVYLARTSIAQPDFTAECLAANNAGAQVILVGMESASVRRVITACNRQGYHPMISGPGLAFKASMADDPAWNNMYSSWPMFPWWQTGTPATDDFQAAVKAFGRGMELTTGVATGWVAGKLFEKAAADLGKPTSAALLEGLWKIKNDDLGGLTMPLTFVRNQPPKPRACGFAMALRDKTWFSPDNFKLSCMN